jgi:uncharacterized protein (DUF1015 family)
MAEVIPFKGVLYNVPNISDVSGEDLLAPPYDIISPEYLDELYNRSPYNIVRVDFGRILQEDNGNENKYTRARAYLERWLKEQVLISTEQPYFYSYEVSYNIKGQEKTLRGFLGLVRLEELGKGNIYPHECTHSKPKKDRLALLRMCDANISPIFSLYNSPERKTSSILSYINRTDPYLEARDFNGSVHRLWKITDREKISIMKEELKEKAIFIADGHHRYETAFEYQNEMREKEGLSESPRPYDYVLMFLANMSDEGLTILPTHRLVQKIPEDAIDRLSDYFEVRKISGSFNIEETMANKRRILGFYKGDSDGWYILKCKGDGLSDIPLSLRNLEVTILHELVLKKTLNVREVEYEMDISKSMQLVRDKKFEAVFFVNPTLVEDVEKIALAFTRMPPKSTYFYPKLLTGMVLNIFKNSF